MMSPGMSEDKQDSGDAANRAPSGDVMSSLPRTRPQRPSRRRAGDGGAGRGGPRRAQAKRAPAASARPRPAGVRPSAATKAATKAPPPKRPPNPPSGTDLVGTAVQAAGELAELGLSLGARALRDAVKRIPRP